MSHALDLPRAQNLKPHNDESEDSHDEFDAFADELDSNWYDLIAYDLICNSRLFINIFC